MKTKNFIKQLLETFSTFSQYSCLKANHEKCEIAGTGVLKIFKVAHCVMKCIDLCENTIRITGVHFSYNKTKQDEKNVLEIISKNQNVLKI